MSLKMNMITLVKMNLNMSTKMNMNTGLRIQLVSCVLMVTFLSCIFSVRLLSNRGHEIHHLKTVAESKHVESLVHNTLPKPDVIPKSVVELLEATRAAARAANDGEDPPSLSQEELQNWTMTNPCRSRVELTPMYARRKDVRDMADNHLWDMVLKEYGTLHRTCMQKVGGTLREQFLEMNNTSGCKFAVADIDWGIPAGLSNRVLSITSVVLYAILTQRVVLVPQSTLMTTLMCEPFPGSSWDLDAYSPFSFYPWSEEAKHIWVFFKDLYADLDDGMTNRTSAYLDSPKSNVFAASMELSQYHPDNRFFCDTEQASIHGLTWLYFTGCIYTIPKFFAVPTFRRTLDALFPGRFVLTQMLRSIMLPKDYVWEKVVESDNAYFPRVDHRVGIQVRYYYGRVQYEEMNDIFNERIMSCAIDNGIFPALQTNASAAHLTEQKGGKGGKSVQIFVASLYPGFQEHMQNVYMSTPLASPDNVTLIQLSNNSVQSFGVDVDAQSLVEIFLLSFSDTLLNTPISTFGGLAQAYGSLIPWKIETRKGDDLLPCERDTTVDLCYQTAEVRYECPYNNLNGLRISDLAPYFQTCLYNFTQVGVQLTTDHSKVPLPPKKRVISSVYSRAVGGTTVPSVKPS
ncbi:unnamed protein product [Calypogeia fissa]